MTLRGLYVCREPAKLRRLNADRAALLGALDRKQNLASFQRKQGVILAHADEFTRMEFGTALTHDDRTSRNEFAAVGFNTQAF